MFINGIGTATPEKCYSKAECWEAFRKSDWFGKLDLRAHAVAQAVLLRDNGIESRYLAVDSLAETFEIDPDILHQRFLANAPSLASQAGADALVDAELQAKEIDAIVISTCTGYICPGLSGYVIEALGLRKNILAFDLVGQGCAAALPNLQMADALIASGGCRHVLSVCVEVCSAAMYLDNDPGVLISACLFGDGAGAAVVSANPAQHRRRMQWHRSASSIDTTQRQALQFEQRQCLLRNILTRRVPQLAGDQAKQLLDSVLDAADVQKKQIRTWIMHAGGRDVLLALQKTFGVETDDFRYSAAMLRQYGNLSSAFVYFVLQAALNDDAEGGWWWLSSFGAGFSCHGALLEVA
ncbi:MAG: 3-oxoacyl-[acyl-carrier-protein] synthase III C-terminal domain-containing protein [Pseudomonadota bacterium]